MDGFKVKESHPLFFIWHNLYKLSIEGGGDITLNPHTIRVLKK